MRRAGAVLAAATAAIAAAATARVARAVEDDTPAGADIDEHQPGASGLRLGVTMDAGTADALHLQPGLVILGGRAGTSPYSAGLFVDADVPLQQDHPVKLRLGPLLRIAISPGSAHHAGIELGPMVAAAFRTTEAEPNRVGFGYVLFDVMSTPRSGRVALDAGFKVETLGLYDIRDVRAGLVLAFLFGRNTQRFAPPSVLDGAQLDRLLATLGVGSQQFGVGDDTRLHTRRLLDLSPRQSFVVPIVLDSKEVCFSIGAIALDGVDLQIDLRQGPGSDGTLVAADRLNDNEPLVTYCPRENEKLWAHIVNQSAHPSPVAYQIAERPRGQLFPERLEGRTAIAEPQLGGQQEIAVGLVSLLSHGSGVHLTALGLPGAGLVAGVGDCQVRGDEIQPWRLGQTDASRTDLDAGIPATPAGPQCLKLRSVHPTPVRIYRGAAP